MHMTELLVDRLRIPKRVALRIVLADEIGMGEDIKARQRSRSEFGRVIVRLALHARKLSRTRRTSDSRM